MFEVSEFDETNAINTLINSKLILGSELSAVNFSLISGNRFRIAPRYTEAFMKTHVEHIHYIEFYPTEIVVYNAIWNSSTQAWSYVGKRVNLS